MSKSSGRPDFEQIYRQQYRQVSASRTSRAFRIIFPLILLIGVIFAHSLVVSIILGALAVVLLTAAIIWTRKQRRDGRETP
jgi:Flp pilus assembly protein TadB